MNNQYEIRSHDGTIHETKELKSLVVVGTETSMNLKTAIQKTDIINQSDNVFKDTIALP